MKAEIASVVIASAGFVAAASIVGAPLLPAALVGLAYSVATLALTHFLKGTGAGRSLAQNCIFNGSLLMSNLSKIALLFAVGIISSNPLNTALALGTVAIFYTVSSIASVEIKKTTSVTYG